MLGKLKRPHPIAGLSLMVALACASGAAGAEPNTTMASVGTGGVLPECPTAEELCYSVHPDITPDGRYASFASVVQNLVPGPHTPTPIPQILLHDRHACTTVRISQTPSGQPANQPCTDSSLSADGSLIAFRSRATNLVAGVPAGVDQIYLYDAHTGAIELISKSSAGAAANASCAVPTISDDGRWILFQSDASNLVSHDTNGHPDIFIYDRQSGIMRLVSMSVQGVQGNNPSRRPHMSSDGRFIAFDSAASNLIPQSPGGGLPLAYLLDRDSDNDGVFDEPGGTSLSLVSVNSKGQIANGAVYWPAVSDDGTLVAFATTASNLVPHDTNGAMDIFVRDRNAQSTTRESIGPRGAQTTAGSYFPIRFAGNNRYLTFHSPAQQLVEGGHNGMTHIIRRDMQTGENIILSRNSEGELADSSSEVAIPSASGTSIVFTSAGYNMIPGGSTNPGWVNVYVRSLRPADLTGNDAVDVSDLLMLLAHWGDGPCSIANINQDDTVDVADLLQLLADWGA